MWKWYNADGTQPAGDIPDSQANAGTMSVSDLTEQLAQTEQLVVQLKELIREKDNELRLKDQQLKEEKESSEAKVSKAKLQNKAKIASLSSQLEELKKVASPKKQEKKSEHGKVSGDGEPENASANRGKILVLKRRVEELESQLSLKNEELKQKLETQRQRGSEMDAMLAEKEKKLAEKEAYIIELQISAGKSVPKETENSADNLKNQKDSANQDLQILIQNLTRKVGESEERCSLLQEQTESLKSLLNKEKKDFQEKEAMYAENIRVYQNMILEKEKDMKELSEKHEQELFKLAAKSDATADLHQLLKALKQKLHEEEEVLLGKNQVIDVLQKELDNKDQQFTEMNEKYKRVQSEKENLQSKLDAEKHVMRAQLKDMMDKHETELRRLSDKHSIEIQDIQEKSQTVLQLQKQLQDLGSSKENQVEPTEVASPAVVKLKDEVKLKTEEASKSEAKFLKMKAWSKSKIRQLEEELKISETKNRDLELLKNKIFELEEDKRNMEDKLESVTELQTLNEQLLAKLVIYEEQQRKLQADLEQVAKRADSQTSESGSVDELQSQMLEWQDMNMETEPTQHHDPEEKSVLAMRMVQIEEEREGLIEDDWFFPGCSDPAMDSGQQELEEELSTARGMGKLRQARRKVRRGSVKLQDEYEYNNKSFEDENLTLDSIESAEGENMGGLRTVVEELELERNQLQEQIMGLEERCQELEDKLQLQARIESLQNENERLQTQLGQFRHQQSRESEKSQDLITDLNEQVKGLTDRNMFLKNAIEEKDQIMREMTSKLEQLRLIENTLQQKELLHKEICEKLEHSEQQREEATKKRTDSETELSALKVSNSELTEKVSAFKEMVSRQESCLQKMQLDLDQTNEELDRLNTSHLEERSQLIHDLQRCERDMDILKDVLQEKDKEMASLTASLTEYTDQISVLKDQIHFKEEQLREMADTLVKAERESHILRETQSSDMQETSAKMSSLSEQLNEINMELMNVKSLNECKTKEAEELIRQISENNITIKNLRLELQAQSVTHNNHVTECSSQITSLKEQLNASVAKLDETEMKYRKEIENLKSQLEKDSSEREKIAGLLEEKSNKEKSFENELKLAKEQYNKLISGISKKDEEIEKLSKEVAVQKEHCDKLDRELQTKEEHLSTLQQTSENVLRDSEEKLKTLQEKNQEFQSQLCDKNKMINTFEAEKNELYAKYTGLERTLAERDQTLSAQLNSVEELKRKVEELENHNKGLCSQQEHVVETLHQKESEVFSLNQTLLDLQNKVTHTEKLLTDEQTTVSKLLADKDELLAKVDSISAQCVLNDSVVAAQLEEKAKECLSVKEQLIKEQELSQRMETQVRSLEKELKEAQRYVEEKDDALQAKMSECNFVCEALTQNQEKNMQLLKQVEELSRDIESRKLALHEKDVFINLQRVEAEVVKSNFEKLQGEEQELREKYVNVSKNLEQLNVTIQMLQQKLCHKTEENATLSTIAENRSKEIEKLRIEKDEALVSLSNMKTHCESLQSQVDKTQSEGYSLKQQLDTLQLENEKLGSNLEVTSTALAKKTDEITLLSSHLSQQGHTILSLNDQIDTIRMEKQALFNSVEVKDALLFQKEELIKQTEKRLEGEGHYLQLISKLQNELQSAISERTLQQQTTEEQEAQLKKLVQEVKLYKDKSEEAELLRTQLSDHMEVISNLHSQIQNLRDNIEELNVTLTKKEDSLKEKDGSYMKLKARLAGVKNSLGQQKSQVENLISENNQYKADLLEKEGALKNSLLVYEDLKQKFQNKEEQCETLIQQAASIEEINSRQTREINELKTLIRETETSLLNKEALIKSQLEEKIALLHSVEEKDALLFQKEELIKQTEKRLEGEGHYLQQISKLQNELQRAISERTLQQQTTEEQEVQLKKLIQEVKLYKDKSEEAELLRTPLSDLKLKFQNKEEQCETLIQQAASIEELNSRQTREINELKTLIKESETSLLNKEVLIKSQLEEKSTLVSGLQARVTALSNKLKDLEQLCTDQDNTIQNLQEKYATLYEQKRALELSLVNKEEEIAEMHKVSDEKDARLQATDHNVQALTNESNRLREELDRSATNFKNLSDALNENADSMTQSQHSVKLLKTELETLNTEYQRSLTHLRELTQENEQKELEILNLQETCGSQSQQIENLKTEVENLNSSFLQVKSDAALQNEQLQLQCESLKCSFEKDFKTLQEEKASSLSSLQKQLTEKTELVEDLKEQFAHHARESEAQMHSEALQLKNENHDLRKQVSGHVEEICALKGKIEILDRNIAELQHKSESVNEQNISLANRIQSKENALQVLLKDLHFVEEQLSVLCSESFTEYSSLDDQFEYESKLEKLSSMLCVVSNYKASMAELQLKLEEKDREIGEKSHSLLALGKERDLLQVDLQKLKAEISTRDTLMEELTALKVANNLQRCALQEKDERLENLSMLITELQKEVALSKDEIQKKHLVLDKESRKVLELTEDAKETVLQVQTLNVQLNQQKELITTLSEQMKEKDASLMQVMESMSNEMVRFSEEKNRLHLECQNLQSSNSSFVLRIEELLENLEASKIELDISQKTLANKENLLSTLASEKANQLEKFSKEKENLKRKLQAALAVRKDLMHKIEKLEKDKDDEISREQHKKVELEKMVEELNCKLETMQSQNSELQSFVQLNKQELQERDIKVCELGRVITEKEAQLEELLKKVFDLQDTISQKENMCAEYSKIIIEKELYITKIQNSLDQNLKSLEKESLDVLEDLNSHLDITTNSVDIHPEGKVTSVTNLINNSAQVDHVNLNLKNGVGIVSKSLFQSTECVDATNKDEHPIDLEDLRSRVQEFELLKVEYADLQNIHEAKCKENEQITLQIHSLQLQTQDLEEHLLENRMQMSEKELKLEDQRQKLEDVSQEMQKMEQYEKIIFELKTSVHNKDDELLHLNSQYVQLLNESRLLKDEMQKLSSELVGKHEEICGMKRVLSQLDQYKVEKETLTTEITQLQNKVEASKTEIETLERTVEKFIFENDEYLELCRVNKCEIEKLKQDLELSNIALLEKGEELATLKDLFETQRKPFEEEINLLCSKLKDSQEEGNQLQISLSQARKELEENAKNLEKVHAELLWLKTNTTRSTKEEDRLTQQANVQWLNQKSVDINQGLPEIRAENIQSGDDHNKTVCDACSRKQVLIEELESKILQITKERASLIEKQDKKFAEECSAKDQFQRKLQAALISRKDLLKENKSLKEKINSLNLEVDELKRSVAGVCENNTSEFSALSQKYQELVSENDRLLLVNENLSAACESLKSTMETIVQEKEAFSFQLNSLKDSQTVELSGWKAKHGELNKEYESLLQAYENISDEIGKMRQVIEMIKKEKHEVLHRFHSVQAENHELEKQIHETNEETDNLRAKLKARETELQHLQMEVDGQVDLLKSGLEHKLEELFLQNQQLMEKNKELQDNFESVKLCLENKERETQNLFVKETELDNLHMELDTYKADMEFKMSELFSEKDTLNSKISELSREILEKEQSLANISKEKSELLEKLSNTEVSMTEEKSILLKLERDIDSLHLEKLNLNEKVKILEDDKALLQEEIENIQEQFDKIKNEREILETELLKSRNNNSHLSEKFKSLQAQTNVLSQQVEFLRAEKNNIMRVKEEHQLQLLRELEERVKVAQDDNRGTKSKSKELQELLREKQQEINQLQKDSIIFQELIFDLEESLKESNSCLEDLKKELANTETKLTTASKDALSFREELSVKEHLLQSAMDQIESLTEQLSRFSPALGKSEMGREVAELSVTANGDQSESLAMKERSNIHRDFGENRLSIKNIHSNDLNNVSKSNGLLKNVLQEGGEVLLHNQMASLLIGNVDDVENELKTIQTKLMQREEEMEKVISEQDRLKASLEKQLAISRHMKEIIDNKDAEISVLLFSKDGELSNYLSQVQSQHRKQVEDYELRLSSFQVEKEKANKEYKMVDRELKRLQGEYEKAIQDKTLISNEIEAFRKSMSSLQTDRDLLCSELKDMHHHHEILLNQKDGMIISTASENNSLKQELRMALNQLDDLNAENAMLGAQLVRYREDLNQVLSMKDHQLKEILRQKLDHIKNLEQEIYDLQKQSREMQSNNSLLKQAADTLDAENQKLKSKVRDQETLIAAINKEKIFVESKENLSSILRDEQSRNNILQLQNGSSSQAGVKQNVYYKDINETNSGHSETEGEMSDRSSEDIYKENKELKSQNESFGKAMAALQNNRDSLIEDFKVLQWRYAGELKAEKIRGDDLERQLGDFKSHLYSILKKNSLLDETLLANESKVTCDQLTDEIESVCNRLASMGLEVNRLSSECTSYTQQIDAFSKSMASLQHDRERLLHQLQVGAIVRDVKQGTASTKVPSNVQETEYLTMDLSRSQTDTVTQVTDSVSNLTSELSKSRPKMEELARLLQEANILQEKAEREITSYQYELAELRSEKNLLAKEAQVLRQQFTVSLADRDRQIAELRKTLNETLPLDRSHGAKNLERITVLGSATATEKGSTLSNDQGPQKNDYQQYLQSIQQKDRLIQELNAKAVEAVQMNTVLSAQLKTVSQGLRDTQMRYSDLQNQHYKLQRDLQSVRVTNQNDSRAAVPSDAPQEGANLPAQMDNPELADLQRRLANTELLYESTQRELSHLSERLLEEKTLREAAEEALTLAEQQCERLDGKTSSRDFDFSIQMDSDDEREALIIDPTQNIVLRKMRGGAVSLRRWLRGRSLYCSKLLTSRSKSRTLFLCYLLILHALVLMCLTGVL